MTRWKYALSRLTRPRCRPSCLSSPARVNVAVRLRAVSTVSAGTTARPRASSVQGEPSVIRMSVISSAPEGMSLSVPYETLPSRASVMESIARLESLVCTAGVWTAYSSANTETVTSPAILATMYEVLRCMSGPAPEYL